MQAMFNFRHREHIDHHNPLKFGMKKQIVMLASSFVHPHVFARLDVCACASWTASVYLHQRQCSWWVVYWSVRLHVRVPVCVNRLREAVRAHAHAKVCACVCFRVRMRVHHVCVSRQHVRACVFARVFACVLCSCVHHMNLLCVLVYATRNTCGNNATDEKLKN